MSEQKPEKKVVSRTMAIAIGIICIVLAVSLVGSIADYNNIINDKNNTISSLNSQISSLNNIINDKNNTISSLNSQISSLNHSIEEMNSQISDLNGSNNYLQNQVEYLYNITSLKNKMIVDNETVYPTEFMNATDGVKYAGYVFVWIKTSPSNSTTLRVAWASSGIEYDQTINVGTDTRMVFPVLPSNVSFIVKHAIAQFTFLVILYY
jgi:TolA-binding protein